MMGKFASDPDEAITARKSREEEHKRNHPM